MEDEIKVSVYCLTYNHEKYIQKALEGFVNQKTNFKYEVFVHDDASTDNTPNIIREYADKYPDIIKPILQTDNKYSKKIRIVSTYILPLMSGKYVACCEGDDYWIDNNKLQLQYDAMEQHTECVMCSHYTQLFDVKRNKIIRMLPNDKLYKLESGVVDGELQFNLVFELLHLSSDFFRKDLFEKYQYNRPEFAKTMVTGDRAYLLYFMNKGSFYFINRIMSQYNKGTEGSYTIRVECNRDKRIKKDIYNLKALRQFESYADDKWKEMICEKIRLEEVALQASQFGYKVYFKKENRDVLNKIPFKSKLKLFVGVFFPFIPRLHNRMRGIYT